MGSVRASQIGRLGTWPCRWCCGGSPRRPGTSIGARYAALGVIPPTGGSMSSCTAGWRAGGGPERIGPPAGRASGLLGGPHRPIRGRLRLRADLPTTPVPPASRPRHPPMDSFLGVPDRIRGRGVRQPVSVGEHSGRVQCRGRGAGQGAGRDRRRRGGECAALRVGADHAASGCTPSPAITRHCFMSDGPGQRRRAAPAHRRGDACGRRTPTWSRSSCRPATASFGSTSPSGPEPGNCPTG